MFGIRAISKKILTAMGLCGAFTAIAPWTVAANRTSTSDGLVTWRSERLTAEAVVERAKADPKLAEYAANRSAATDTVADQMKLATWCARNGLTEEQRAHLTRVLELDPSHATARARLGFKQIDGQWISSEDIERTRDQAQASAKATLKYGKALRSIAAGLQSNNEKTRQAVLAKLADIQDESAIPTLQKTLRAAGEPGELALADTLARMTSQAATSALSELALETTFSDVRDRVTEHLKARAPEQFVPSLLSTLSTPIVSQTRVMESADGRLTFRNQFASENEAARRLTTVDQTFRNRLGGEVTDAAAIAERQVALSTAATRASIAIEDNNQRVCKLLNAVTNLDLPAKPEVWWSWWNDVTETTFSGEKPLYQNYVTQEQVLNRAPSYSRQLSEETRLRYECLVAGTPIWTQTGLQPIETIQAGDLVLSKNTETGELAFKPVLKPTVRPPAPLISIRLADETITASGGHLFFTPENGWQRARQLKAGDQLQQLDSTVAIESTEEVQPEKTYNLIVADFHTYFIGPNQLLSHDNTARR